MVGLVCDIGWSKSSRPGHRAAPEAHEPNGGGGGWFVCAVNRLAQRSRYGRSPRSRRTEQRDITYQMMNRNRDGREGGGVRDSQTWKPADGRRADVVLTDRGRSEGVMPVCGVER